MGPMLATEGKLDQTTAHTMSQQCVEGAGAGARASNDWKQANKGGVGYQSKTICEHKYYVSTIFQGILFLRIFSLNSTCSALRGNVSYDVRSP